MLSVGYNISMSEDRTQRVSFGEAVRHRRKLLGLKQAAIAEALGVSQNTVSRWEISAHPPDGYWLLKLAEVLRADPEELRQGIIHTEGGDQDAVRAEIERLAVQQADTPEDVQMLVSLMMGAITLDPEGLRRAEDYMRLLVERYGRDKDEGGAGEGDELKVKGS